MNFNKIIASLFLLFTYLIGFTHNVIPHCHHNADANHTHLEHHEHHTGSHDQGNDRHVSHNDHLDEGVLDFIICLLSETEHPTPIGDSQFYFSTEKTPRTIGMNLTFLYAMAHSVILGLEPSTKAVVLYADLEAEMHSNDSRFSLPDRAPPTLAV